MKEWNKTDAKMILSLHYTPVKTARGLTRYSGYTYNYVQQRLQRLVDFGIIQKVRKGREVMYTAPTEQACRKANFILKE